MIIGVFGTAQSGKSENAHVFRKHGFQFVDLNDAEDGIRRIDSPLRSFYDEHVPGLVTDDGKPKVMYYPHMAHHPELLRLMVSHELVAATAMVRETLAAATPDSKIVLSWGYLHMLYPLIKHRLNVRIHMDVKDTDGTVGTWMARLLARLKQGGWVGKEPTLSELWWMMRTHHLDPFEIQQTLAGQYGHDRVYIVNTAKPDWGEAELDETLTRLLAT